MKLPAPTKEQLALAWRQMYRPGWPPTLEEALARQCYCVAIHGLARNLGRAAFRAPGLGTAQRSTPPNVNVPPTPGAAGCPATPQAARRFVGDNTHMPQPLTSWISARAARGPGWIDFKRAAANDKDD